MERQVCFAGPWFFLETAKSGPLIWTKSRALTVRTLQKQTPNHGKQPGQPCHQLNTQRLQVPDVGGCRSLKAFFERSLEPEA